MPPTMKTSIYQTLFLLSGFRHNCISYICENKAFCPCHTLSDCISYTYMDYLNPILSQISNENNLRHFENIY